MPEGGLRLSIAGDSYHQEGLLRPVFHLSHLYLHHLNLNLLRFRFMETRLRLTGIEDEEKTEAMRELRFSQQPLLTHHHRNHRQDQRGVRRCLGFHLQEELGEKEEVHQR